MLGVIWNTLSDMLRFIEAEATKEVLTRVLLFSKVASVFDPLGGPPLSSSKQR